MATYKLTLAYDGTDFSGWQAQLARRTVQGVLQEAWCEITGETVRVTATSRTDAGVWGRWSASKRRASFRQKDCSAASTPSYLAMW